MDSPLLKHYRCHCGKLLFKAEDLQGSVEIKCKRCGLITTVKNKNFQEAHQRYDVIAQITDQGIFRFIDNRCMEVLGYLGPEIIDTSIFDLYHADDVDHRKKEFQEMAATDQPFRLYNQKIQRNDGRTVLVEICAIPYQTNQKHFIIGCTISAETF